jgi:hypothetical protein
VEVGFGNKCKQLIFSILFKKIAFFSSASKKSLIFFSKKMYQIKNCCVIPIRGLQASNAKLLKTKDYASPILPSAAVFSSI